MGDFAENEDKRGRLYCYEFVWRGERIRLPTKQANKRIVRADGGCPQDGSCQGRSWHSGPSPHPYRTVQQFEDRFVKAIETDCSDKPSTIQFYKAKLRYLLDYEPLAGCRLSSIDEALVDAFKQHRRKGRAGQTPSLL